MSVRNVMQYILFVGEEEVGYDDMVDSMMQAWNGGIPVSSAHNAAGDLHHKDAQQGRERKIFSLPERRSREKRRKAKPEVCCCLISCKPSYKTLPADCQWMESTYIGLTPHESIPMHQNV